MPVGNKVLFSVYPANTYFLIRPTSAGLSTHSAFFPFRFVQTAHTRARHCSWVFPGVGPTI